MIWLGQLTDWDDLGPNSMTCRLRMLALSTSNFRIVLILWKPCLPAAPGFKCNRLNFLSGITFRMCECPQMIESGWWAAINVLVFSLYRPTDPAIWMTSVLWPIKSIISHSGQRLLMFVPSIFPYTQRVGAIFSIESNTLESPTSPAWMIKSDPPKWWMMRSSIWLCVSLIKVTFMLAKEVFHNHIFSTLALSTTPICALKYERQCG